MPLRLDSMPDAIQWREGLPRPDWSVIADWVDQNVSPSDLAPAWRSLALQWLEILRTALGTGYEIDESDAFFILSRENAKKRARLLDWCEALRHSVLNTLGSAAASDVPLYGKHVVLAFHDLDAYYDYISEFYPVTGEFGPSAGCFISVGYGHIAVCMSFASELDRTLAHELTHNLLWRLPLPLWLNEGLTQVVEDVVLQSSSFGMYAELARRHRAHWNEQSIDEFWSGTSFSHADEGMELSYSLAQVLVRNLLADFPAKALEFVRRADYRDAGEAAAREVLGVGLNERVTQFLGEGNWHPRSDYGTS